MYKLLCVILLSIVYRVDSEGAALGSRCSQNGFPGVCWRRSECSSATQLPIEFRMVAPCEDDGGETVVCCLDTRVTPVAKLPTIEPVLDPSLESKCAAVELSAEKTGRKAWDQCIEYQKQLVYPCKRSVTLKAQYSRHNYCKHSAGALIVGGKVSVTDEFPHMVQLGCRVNDYVAWHCSGTLLSDRFILTSGHCTSMPIRGQTTDRLYKVSHAAVGSLPNQNQRPNPNELKGCQVYDILPEGIIKYPKYDPPRTKHDIALLKTASRMFLSHAAVPACLDIFGGDTTNATGTGWGKTETKDYSYILRKVALNRFSDEACWNITRGARLGSYNATTQLCYGHHTERADTCLGDSGGPLTIHNPGVNCMYSVIGITSYAKTLNCGQPGIPGVYMRVSYYVPWIEETVWPESNVTSELRN